MSKEILKNERLLLNQVAKGDEEAFATLFHAYRNKLFSFILKLSKSKQIAEDVVQDVFLKIWNKRTTLTEIENFNAYVYRMAHNQVVNLLKKRSREILLDNQKKFLKSSFSSAPDTQLSFKNVRLALQKAVEDLPPKQKTVYRLKREQGLKHEEIAQQLNISPSTVKNHLTQALKTIRKKLYQYHPEIWIVGILLKLFL